MGNPVHLVAGPAGVLGAGMHPPGSWLVEMQNNRCGGNAFWQFPAENLEASVSGVRLCRQHRADGRFWWPGCEGGRIPVGG
jgi:hypothetical protein